MPRMNILNALEEEAHDAPPKFSSVERNTYFELPHDLARIAEDSLRHSTNQVSFILACGYFRAAKRFFTKPPHSRDLEYVCANLGLSIENNPLSPPCMTPVPGFRDLSAKSKFLAASQIPSSQRE